jgi:Zn-dependent peptidase ImmA (M78 family)
LADHIGVTVWGLDNLKGLTKDDLKELTVSNGNVWSAFTLRIGNRHLVVFNPRASEPRINSVVMHEFAHIILGHKLVSAELTNDGHLIPGNYDQTEEDEANWLGGTLLLPRSALLSIRRRGISDKDTQNEFLVSNDMLTWRFRMTGVNYQIANAKRRWG